MHLYITLVNWTDQGIQNVKALPQRLEAARKAVEGGGGKWLGSYLTMGQHDLVVITEAPSDEAYATLILAIGAQGNIRSTTLRAFSEDEAARIIGNIPGN